MSPPGAKGAAPPRGRFITLEGGEGAGKTTQARMLVRRLEALGRKVESTREPGGTPLGRRLEELLSGSSGRVVPGRRAELLLYLAARAQHVEKVIQPALERGMVVVCDRFIDSSEVYQGRARGLGVEAVRRLNRWACGETWPDLTILLDLDPVLGLKRVRERQDSLGLGLDRLEREEMPFHQAVRQGFLDQARGDPGRVKVVAADRPPDEVAEEVWSLVKEIL